MLTTVLQDQLSPYIHSPPRFSQAFHDPEYQGNWSLDNPTQASGLSVFADHGAQDSLNLQIPPNPVGTQQHAFGGTGTSQAHTGSQMLPHVLEDQLSLYMDAPQGFRQAFHNPQHEGSWSL